VLTDPVALLLDRLDGVRPSGQGWMARCPGHEDRHASLSVAFGDDERALLICHAGCTTEVVLGAVGLDVRFVPADEWRRRSSAARSWTGSGDALPRTSG